MFDNEKILITGGTGTVGRKLVTTLLKRHNMREIAVFSRDEQKHYRMGLHFKDERIQYIVGDVRDADRLGYALRDVDTVIHTAAMKHVSIAEEHPSECIATNIHGANNLITAVLNSGVKRVMALSTDKAASPINLYGASKLVSDKLFIAANRYSSNSGPMFSLVRYGNVSGSAGSVIPLFRDLISSGSKFLPITSPKMTRFCLSPQDGVNFILECFRMMKGGEIFIPKIPSYRILDLAAAMAPSLQHKLIGVRSGEKVHEVMCCRDDSHLTYEFGDYFVILPSISLPHRDHCDLFSIDGEIGKPVRPGFEYSSETNPEFLTVDQIRTHIQHLQLETS